MAITGISEFTFGFAFLHEQTNRHWVGLTAVPVLPSLQEEAALGWDARLPRVGVEHYYQFKLADYLFRSNANLRKDGTFGGPYYRLSLHRRNNNRQHNLLKWFSEDFPYTYYVAPEVSSWNDFNDAFLDSRVVRSSRLIPLAFCDYHEDEDQHIIAFQQGVTEWEERSEPIHHEFSYVENSLDKLWTETLEAVQPLTVDRAAEIWEKQRDRAATFFSRRKRPRLQQKETDVEMLPVSDAGKPPELLPEKLLNPPEDKTVKGYLTKAGELSNTVFGTVMVILGPADQVKP